MEQRRAFELIDGRVLDRDAGDGIHVTLTYAQSADGVIGSDGSDRLILSCPQSMVFTHCLRQTHDAILIGIGTLLADNPKLTTRLADVKLVHPRPVIVDPTLRIPPSHPIFLRSAIVVSKRGVCPVKREAIEASGGVVEECKSNASGLISMRDAVGKLERLGVRRLMVEGGAMVIGCFLREECYDAIAVTVSPQIVSNGIRVESLDRIKESKDVTYHQFGIDTIVIGKNQKNRSIY